MWALVAGIACQSQKQSNRFVVTIKHSSMMNIEGAESQGEKFLTAHEEFKANMSEGILKIDICLYLLVNWPMDDKDLEFRLFEQCYQIAHLPVKLVNFLVLILRQGK